MVLLKLKDTGEKVKFAIGEELGNHEK